MFEELRQQIVLPVSISHPSPLFKFSLYVDMLGGKNPPLNLHLGQGLCNLSIAGAPVLLLAAKETGYAPVLFCFSRGRGFNYENNNSFTLFLSGSIVLKIVVDNCQGVLFRY